MVLTIVFSLFPLLAIAGAVFDFLTLRIPNWLNALIGVSFLIAALVFGMPWSLMGVHLLCGLILLCVGFALFAANLIGGGDAKMLAAIGLWVGFEQLVPFLIYMSLAGGLLAIAMLLLQRFRRLLTTTGLDVFASIMARKIDLPYGMAIAAGALAVLPKTWWFAALQ